MGLLDGLLNPQTPEQASMLYAALNLLGAKKGEGLAPGLLAGVNAGQAFSVKQQNDQLRKMQVESMQQEMAAKKAAFERQQGLLGLQKQFYSPGAPAQPLDPRQMEGGQEFVPQQEPSFNQSGYANAAMARGLMTPMEAAALEAKERVKVGAGETVGSYRNGKFVADFSAPDKPPSGFTRGPDGKLQVDPIWFDTEKKLKEAGRTTVPVSVNTAKSFWSSTGDELGKQLVNELTAAKGGVETIRQAGNIMGSLDKGGVMSGPGATVRLKVAQIAQTLGFPANEEGILQTRNAITGLANLTLSARQELKGQGQITDRETAMLERARSGDIDDLTPAEVRRIAELADKAGRIAIRKNAATVAKMKQTPDAASLLPFFQLDEPPEYATGKPEDPAVAAALRKYGPKK